MTGGGTEGGAGQAELRKLREPRHSEHYGKEFFLYAKRNEKLLQALKPGNDMI